MLHVVMRHNLLVTASWHEEQWQLYQVAVRNSIGNSDEVGGQDRALERWSAGALDRALGLSGKPVLTKEREARSCV